MAGEPMSYWDYVKAAFWKPVRSRVLGAMPLSQMLLVSFGLAGFFNPGFWLLGLAATVVLPVWVLFELRRPVRATAG